MSKHTPGPWHIGMKPGPMIYGPLGEQVADCRGELLDKDEAIANIKLIAASLAMYEAACKVLADWERYTVSSMCNHTLHGIADLRAAIAQAEGDAQESGKICSKFSHWDEPEHNCPLCEKESGK